MEELDTLSEHKDTLHLNFRGHNTCKDNYSELCVSPDNILGYVYCKCVCCYNGTRRNGTHIVYMYTPAQ